MEKCSAGLTLKSFDESLKVKLLKELKVLAVGMTAKDEKQ